MRRRAPSARGCWPWRAIAPSITCGRPSGRERNALEFEETDHPALYTDMEHDILTSDSARMVKAAMEKLSPHQRQVIELAYFEGLSQTEMAERMGQPLGTVKTWVRAALKNLRDELGVGGVGMTREELQDSYELYVWAWPATEERDEIRDHLNRGCEVCMAEVKRARHVAALMGQTPALATPSPKLRKRILASVGFEQRRFGWAPFLAAALLLSLFAAFYFSGRERDFADARHAPGWAIAQPDHRADPPERGLRDSERRGHHSDIVRKRTDPAAQGKGLCESFARRAADRVQPAADTGGQDVRDVGGAERR